MIRRQGHPGSRCRDVGITPIRPPIRQIAAEHLQHPHAGRRFGLPARSGQRHGRGPDVRLVGNLRKVELHGSQVFLAGLNAGPDLTLAEVVAARFVTHDPPCASGDSRHVQRRRLFGRRDREDDVHCLWTTFNSIGGDGDTTSVCAGRQSSVVHADVQQERRLAAAGGQVHPRRIRRCTPRRRQNCVIGNERALCRRVRSALHSGKRQGCRLHLQARRRKRRRRGRRINTAHRPLNRSREVLAGVVQRRDIRPIGERNLPV